MSSISLAMIVKNEEDTLDQCLESVRTLVNEIVIVDTGSTDKTVEIAEKHGAKVHHFKWCDDFAAARNESLKHCTGDWVLILDADEGIDPLDHQIIMDACNKPKADAYYVVIRNYMATPMETSMDRGAVPLLQDDRGYTLGKGLPFYSDNTGGLRLAKRFDGLFFDGRIHEAMGNSILSRGKKLGNLSAVIHHYGKLLKDREQYKADYYLELARREAEKAPHDCNTRFNLMQQALVAEKWDLALKEAEEYLKLTAGTSKAELYSIAYPIVLYCAGLAQQKLERHAEAITYFDILLGVDPKHALAKVCKGFSSGMIGNFDEGRKNLSQGIELEPGYLPAYGCLAELELKAYNHDAARSATLRGLELVPTEESLYDMLLKIELDRNNNQQAALDAIQGIQQCPSGGGGKWHRLAAVFLSKANQKETARAIIELGLRTFPGDAELVRVLELI